MKKMLFALVLCIAAAGCGFAKQSDLKTVHSHVRENRAAINNNTAAVKHNRQEILRVHRCAQTQGFAQRAHAACQLQGNEKACDWIERWKALCLEGLENEDQ